MSLEQLSKRYSEHNRVERGAGFVFAGQERVELFRRYVGGPGRHVLDLGCRDGALTQAYAGGNEIVGVDADREALAEAQKLGIETRWADLDDALPFESGTFDIVVAGELLEHLRDPRSVVSEVLRVLRAGGTFVGSVPNAYRLKNRLRFLARTQARERPHASADVRARRRARLARRLRGRAPAPHRGQARAASCAAVCERHRLLGPQVALKRVEVGHGPLHSEETEADAQSRRSAAVEQIGVVKVRVHDLPTKRSE